jgi:hypothetical protein
VDTALPKDLIDVILLAAQDIKLYYIIVQL